MIKYSLYSIDTSRGTLGDDTMMGDRVLINGNGTVDGSSGSEL